MNKELAIIGLGKMGGNMARRMVDQGWRVVGYNRTATVTDALAKEGVTPASSIQEAVSALQSPRVIWMMLPAGDLFDDYVLGPDGIASMLSPGDIVIDGGNSFFKDSARRHEELKKREIHFLDCGTSGGPGGARRGACLMIGGERSVYESIEPLFKDFACENGYQFFEGPGAGHFVKMIHNGIEYGMMQAIAEGFEVLKTSDFKLDLHRVTDLYNHGSVIESHLVQWLKQAYEQNGPELTGISSTVSHTGEGAWTVQVAEEMGIDVPIIKGSLEARKQSADHPRYAGKVLSALREQFGGHSVRES